MTEMTQMCLGKEVKRGRDKIHIKTPPSLWPVKILCVEIPETLKK